MPALRHIDEIHRPCDPAADDRADLGCRNDPPRTLRRTVYLALASLFFGIAALGALLPGLPCTPFLLVTSYFLLRSSPRLHRRMLNSRLFGPVLHDWQERGGVTRRVKAKAILIVVLVVGTTLYFADWPLSVLGSVAALALVGIIVISRLPAARGD